MIERIPDGDGQPPAVLGVLHPAFARTISPADSHFHQETRRMRP
jgi:hypothetical protein